MYETFENFMLLSFDFLFQLEQLPILFIPNSSVKMVIDGVKLMAIFVVVITKPFQFLKI